MSFWWFTLAHAAPEITVLDPGAEPRTPLRLALTPGTDTVVIETRADTRMTLSGPAPTPPPTASERAMTLTVEVTGADAAGADVTITLASTRQTVTPPRPRQPPLPPGALDGTKGTMRVSPRGEVSEASWTVPPDLDPRVAQAARSAGKVVQTLVPRFPEEAVGAGATWRVRTDFEAGPLSVVTSTTWRLVSLEGGVAKLEAQVSAEGAEGALDLGPDAPVAATLDALTGSGTITVEQPLTELIGARTSDVKLHAELTGSKGRLSASMATDVSHHQTVTPTP